MAIKENSADILKSEHLKREHELATKSKICDIMIIILFCIFISGFAILHISIPDRDFSGKENKSLEQFPKFSAESLFNGDYTEKISLYLSDQFPFRDFFVELKANAERTILKMENGGVMFGNNALTDREDPPNMENLSTNLTTVQKFTSKLEENGIYTIFAPAGRRADVCDKDLPIFYGDENQNMVWNEIDNVGKGLSGKYINLRTPLREKDALGEEVYYRTDHHWTSLGAYYAYTEVWKMLPDSLTEGKECRTIEEFTRETVTDDFFGTILRRSGATWVETDKIELFRFEGDDTLPVTDFYKKTTVNGLYRYDYLEEVDKYSVFLGENVARLDIGTGDRQKIVMIKDSFAQSVVPFLAADFDIVLIDPRSGRMFKDGIYNTILEIDPAAVVILLNSESLTDTPVLNTLLVKLK